MKKFIMYLASLVMAVACFVLPLKANASTGTKEAYVTQSADGTVLTFRYDDKRDNLENNGVVTYDIPDNITIDNTKDDYGWINVWARRYNDKVTKVVFLEEFSEYKPTSTCGWFEGMEKLTEIEGLEYLDTSEVTDMSGMFIYCISLKSLDCSTFDTSKVQYMTKMFYECFSVESINVSSFDTSNVKGMAKMFAYCKYSLKELDLSSFSTESIESIHVENARYEKGNGLQEMFEGCSELTTIYVGKKWQPDIYMSGLRKDLSGTAYDLFLSDTKLVGGNGTTYDRIVSNYVSPVYIQPHYYSTDILLAVPDLPGQPGYMTLVNPLNYTSHFDENGNLIIDSVETDGTENGHILIKAPEAPDKTGYTFLGWKSSNGAKFKANSYINLAQFGYNFTPIWKANVYEVKYETEISAYINQEVKYYADYGEVITIEENMFERSGYRFREWSDGTATYNPGDSYTVSGDVTFKAVWDEIYTLTFTDENGLAQIIQGIQGEVVEIPECQSVKEGYEFSKWSDGGLTVKPGQKYAINGNVTFTANWEKIHTVSFKYESQSITFSTLKGISGTVVEMPENHYTNSGYRFSGWTDGTDVYQPGDKYEIKKDVTFTPMWEKLYKLSFVYDLTQQGMGFFEKDPIYGIMGETVNLYKDGFNRNGYRFIGWNDGTTTFIKGAEYTIVRDVTFNADWEKLYTLTFVGGGSTGGVAPKKISDSQNAVVELPVNTFVREGYRFNGWTDGTNTYKEGHKYKITKDVKFTAKWTKLYTLSFTGGEGATGNAPENIIGINKDVVTLPKNTFVKEGFVFEGWSDGTTLYAEGSSYTLSKKDVTFVASWKMIPPKPADPTPKQEAEEKKIELIRIFVDRCYEVALGRKADDEGYEYWKNMLLSGKECAAQVVYGFVTSDEYKAKNTSNEQFIEDLYTMYFGRPSDEGGFAYWLNELNSGADREVAIAGFSNSDEFYNLCNEYGITCGTYIIGVPVEQQGLINGFVERLYEVCLQRGADRVGMADWSNKLASGEMSGSQVANGFIFSDEFKGLNLSNEEFVKYMYKAFFGRPADEVGFAYWTEGLNGGSMTREDVFNGFVASNEFISLCESYGIRP